jgi:hypothetical protein
MALCGVVFVVAVSCVVIVRSAGGLFVGAEFLLTVWCGVALVGALQCSVGLAGGVSIHGSKFVLV